MKYNQPRQRFEPPDTMSISHDVNHDTMGTSKPEKYILLSWIAFCNFMMVNNFTKIYDIFDDNVSAFLFVVDPCEFAEYFVPRRMNNNHYWPDE